MFYHFIKYWVRLSILFFCRRVTIHNKKALQLKGPMIIACNHPNSFLDALVLGAYMKEPVYFITRGDIFKKKIIRKILGTLKMIPIFRIRDGKDKLSLNQQTFNATQEVLKKNGIVLIFVEGFCEYQTELQLPLKKGAPRILSACWKQNVDVKVLPVWLRYDSFTDYGKILDINLGEIFGKEITRSISSEAAQILQINKRTEKDLLQLSTTQHTHHGISYILKIILFPFAMIGKIVHIPFYIPIQKVSYVKAHKYRHYDSVMLAVLTFGYPFYLLIITYTIFNIFHHWSVWLVLIIFPMLAKAYVYWKK